jgi:lipopolysaccharide transport system permease protein
MATADFVKHGSVDNPARNSGRYISTAFSIAVGDLQARYARSALGIFWFFATPLAYFAIYYVVFGLALRVGWSSSTHHSQKGSVSFFIGLAVYLLFADLIQSSLNLFDIKRMLIKRIPIPLWVLWLANVFRALLRAAVFLSIAIGFAIVNGSLSLPGLLLVLPAIFLTILFCGAASLALAAFAPFMGDVREPASVAMRLVFYITPIAYPVSMLPDKFQNVVWLNPVTHMVEMIRNALLWDTLGDVKHVLSFGCATLLLIVVSVWIFAKLKQYIPDKV